MNRSKRILSGFMCVLMLFSALHAFAQSQTESVVTQIVFDGKTYENRTNFTWEMENPIPAGGVKWNGDKEQVVVKTSDSDDIDTTPDGLQYIRNQLIFIAEQGPVVGDEFAAIEQLMANYGLRIVGYIAIGCAYQVETLVDVTYEQLMELKEQLKLEDGIVSDTVMNQTLAYVSNNLTVKAQKDDVVTSNQTLWDGDVLDENDPKGANWGVEYIKAPSIWKYDGIMDRIRCSVIEVDGCAEHNDLAYALNVSAPDDHGTHVAGTIAARHDDRGVSGIFHNASLVAIKMDGFTDEYQATPIFPFGLCASTAIAIATQNDAQMPMPCVLNMSLGFKYDRNSTQKGQIELNEWLIDASNNREHPSTKSMQDNADYYATLLLVYLARDYDFVIVKSAGNDYNVVHLDARYGCYPNMIAATPAHPEYQKIVDRIVVVGAIGITDDGHTGHANFSKPGDRVDILAPGVDIYSTYANNKYGYMSGTSMAAPHVAGVAAAVWAIDPSMSGDKVKRLVRGGANRHIEPDAGDVFRTKRRYYPILNALNAVELAREEASPAVITGTVTDSTKIFALPGATIRLMEGNAVAAQTTAMEDGTYTVSVQPGIYELYCEQAGYTPQKTTVTIKAGEAQTEDFALSLINPETGTGKITGHVQDEQGHSLSNVKVQLAASSTSVVTDGDGRFTIECPIGRAELNFTWREDYETAFIYANVIENQTIDIGNIVLKYVPAFPNVSLNGFEKDYLIYHTVAVENGESKQIDTVNVRIVKNNIIHVDTLNSIGDFTRSGLTVTFQLDDELIHGAEMYVTISGPSWTRTYSTLLVAGFNNIPSLPYDD